MYQGCTVTKTSHLQIHYFRALLWAHPILHISTIRVKRNTLREINNFWINLYYDDCLSHEYWSQLFTQSRKINLSGSSSVCCVVISLWTLLLLNNNNNIASNTRYSGSYELLHKAVSSFYKIWSCDLSRTVPYWVTTVDFNKYLVMYTWLQKLTHYVCYVYNTCVLQSYTYTCMFIVLCFIINYGKNRTMI